MVLLVGMLVLCYLGAMKVGTFGGQLEALRREVRNIEKEERQRGNRRAFLGAVGGIVVGSVSAVVIQGVGAGRGALGKTKESAKPEPATPDPLAKKATGPIEDLITSRWLFLDRAKSGEATTHEIIGTSRLLDVAIQRSHPESASLALYFLDPGTADALPAELKPMIKVLSDRRKSRESK